MKVIVADVNIPDDLDRAFQALAEQRTEVIVVLQTSMLLSERRRMAVLAGAISVLGAIKTALGLGAADDPWHSMLGEAHPLDFVEGSSGRPLIGRLSAAEVRPQDVAPRSA